MVKTGSPKDYYSNFHEIGRGSYGKVYIATDKVQKKQFAIKHMIRNVEEDVDGIANEVALLDSSHHISILDIDYQI
jgi:serine/threonine protein kinase